MTAVIQQSWKLYIPGASSIAAIHGIPIDSQRIIVKKKRRQLGKIQSPIPRRSFALLTLLPIEKLATTTFIRTVKDIVEEMLGISKTAMPIDVRRNS